MGAERPVQSLQAASWEGGGSGSDSPFPPSHLITASRFSKDSLAHSHLEGTTLAQSLYASNRPAPCLEKHGRRWDSHCGWAWTEAAGKFILRLLSRVSSYWQQAPWPEVLCQASFSLRRYLPCWPPDPAYKSKRQGEFVSFGGRASKASRQGDGGSGVCWCSSCFADGSQL